MKLSAVAFGLALVLVTSSTQVAIAHEVVSSNGTSALLHTQPADAPVTNLQQTFVLVFNFENKSFDLKDCDCSLEVKKDEKVIEQQPIKPTSQYVSQNDYTFDEPGNYELAVSGQAKSADSPKPFALEYELRVDPGPKEQQSQLPVLIIIGSQILLAVGLIWFFIFRRRGHKVE